MANKRQWGSRATREALKNNKPKKRIKYPVRQFHCAWCGEAGHNRLTCPIAPKRK